MSFKAVHSYHVKKEYGGAVYIGESDQVHNSITSSYAFSYAFSKCTS